MKEASSSKSDIDFEDDINVSNNLLIIAFSFGMVMIESLQVRTQYAQLLIMINVHGK
jgi:hypothetical protein